MERALAMQELPKAYADILRWRDEGASDEEVAGRLGILPASVPLLVRVAEAKLVPLIWAEGAGQEHMRARSP
jgi:hypothetical protein